MSNGIQLKDEILKLAQLRSRSTGCDVRQESARQIAQEAILELDPELNLIIDEDAAFSRDDRLLSFVEVNDIVINGTRIDVRATDDEGRVSIPRYLVGTSYLNGGTLAVDLRNDRSASVLGYVSPRDWDLLDRHAASSEDRLAFRLRGSFDLSELPSLLEAARKDSRAKEQLSVDTGDIARFCGNRKEMQIEDQRSFVEALLNNEKSWQQLQSGISKALVRKTLTHASVWNLKLDNIAEKLKSKFPRLGKDKIKAELALLGENLGGQFDSPIFRQELLKNLTRAELAQSLSGEQLLKATKIAEQVLSGRSIAETVNDVVKSKTALDIAVFIRRQRNRLSDFLEASSDEIAMAFRQLSVQPAYATHSQSPEGVQSVNEALKLLEAAEMAEKLKDMDI